MPGPTSHDRPDTGLQSVFQQAKAAAASEFGRRSNEYESLPAIKY